MDGRYKTLSQCITACCQQTCMTYAIAVCTVKETPDDGQRNCPKYVVFYSKNKFEKSAHLVGFIIRNVSVYFFTRFPLSRSPTWLIENHIRSILKQLFVVPWTADTKH